MSMAQNIPLSAHKSTAKEAILSNRFPWLQLQPPVSWTLSLVESSLDMCACDVL